MANINTSDLKGGELDFAVSLITNPDWEQEDRLWNTIDYIDTGDEDDEEYSPSFYWEQGGPVAELYNIHARRTYNSGVPNMGEDAFRAEVDYIDGVLALGKFTSYGATELIAKMRCLVRIEVGDEVEIPEELS